MQAVIKVIIGLGNPGPKYYMTRHSIGFRVLDALAYRYGASWFDQNNMEIASAQINERGVLLVKPMTFMNNSGAVIPALQKKGIKQENILVVHDDLERAFGKLSFKMGGSAGGHNGLRSIIDYCGKDFMRLRVGIDRPESREMVSDYVLRPLDQSDAEVDQVIERAVGMIEKLFEPESREDGDSE